jgi:uncharacterized alkaline shock family protein YloU
MRASDDRIITGCSKKYNSFAPNTRKIHPARKTASEIFKPLVLKETRTPLINIRIDSRNIRIDINIYYSFQRKISQLSKNHRFKIFLHLRHAD